jgi:hypothetical protein
MVVSARVTGPVHRFSQRRKGRQSVPEAVFDKVHDKVLDKVESALRTGAMSCFLALVSGESSPRAGAAASRIIHVETFFGAL